MKKNEKLFCRQAEKPRNQFLEEEQYVNLASAARECCGGALWDFDGQTDEAWLMQCPKGTDPHLLAGKRIKLPGRKSVGDLQVRAVKNSTLQSESLGYLRYMGPHALRKIPFVGYVVISKRLYNKQPLPGQKEQVIPADLTLPKYLLRERHPLFGRSYKQRIELPKMISTSLSQADKKFLEASAKLCSTANYYKIRSKLLTTTQTLEQKEDDVRQSVLTGRTPQFMKTTIIPDQYKDLLDEEDVGKNIVNPADEIGPAKMRKKKFNSNKHKKEEIQEGNGQINKRSLN
ncbi:GD24362 [Drosophila simulans]|uniref:GD24362 n=1 Tax=Drosophila simulans TaxID=7240 RepID=B4R2I1_DROSI|nr:GD24362 [Drosophila simulans]